MKEDSPAKVTEDAGSNPGATTVRQRKKRKWDQPAESVISAAGLPITGMVSVVPSLAGVIPSGVMTSAFMSASQISPTVSLVQQSAAAIVQKINQIQAKTGAVVITRGKYRPPNGPIENEKPLYLHISSGAHLKDMAERIKAVDLAAAMVEEMLRQVRQPQSASTLLCGVPMAGGLATPPFSTAVFVGLEADPTLNLVSRIRGPNGF